jgi:hypothetical protein
MIEGRLSPIDASVKCSSIAWNPASISPNASGPIAIITESPIAESIE